MSEKCEKCEGARNWIVANIKHPLQKLLRRISGSQRWFDGQGRIITELMEAGASLESLFEESDKATAAWLGRLEERLNYLERQNTQLRSKFQEISKAIEPDEKAAV